MFAVRVRFPRLDVAVSYVVATRVRGCATAASMMHAGVLKKLGAYGIIRLALPLLPEGARHWANCWDFACFNISTPAGGVDKKTGSSSSATDSVSHWATFLGHRALNIVASAARVADVRHGIMAALTFSLIGFFYHQTHNRFCAGPERSRAKIPFIGVCMVMAVMASSGFTGVRELCQ